jgi:hypothetical protein
MISTGLAGYGLIYIARYHFEGDTAKLQGVYRATIRVATPSMLALLVLMSMVCAQQASGLRSSSPGPLSAGPIPEGHRTIRLHWRSRICWIRHAATRCATDLPNGRIRK